jgi:hypothetical protein
MTKHDQGGGNNLHSERYPDCMYHCYDNSSGYTLQTSSIPEYEQYDRVDVVMTKKEAVDHPEHYNPGVYEAINVIEHYNLGFHLGNSVKYILRAGKKHDNVKEDIDKAIWYLQRYKEKL